jgi:hypothetical protein
MNAMNVRNLTLEVIDNVEVELLLIIETSNMKKIKRKKRKKRLKLHIMQVMMKNQLRVL